MPDLLTRALLPHHRLHLMPTSELSREEAFFENASLPDVWPTGSQRKEEHGGGGGWGGGNRRGGGGGRRGEGGCTAWVVEVKEKRGVRVPGGIWGAVCKIIPTFSILYLYNIFYNYKIYSISIK